MAQHLRAWIAYARRDCQFYFRHTRSGGEVDLVVYGEGGFWAIEVKNTSRVRTQDLRALKTFVHEYPKCEPVLLSRGADPASHTRLDGWIPGMNGDNNVLQCQRP